MTQSDVTTRADLILQGRIARRPVTFVGTLVDGKLTQISGCVTLNASLLSILSDLGVDYGEAAKVLNTLVGSGDIVLEKLAAAYGSGKSKSVQVGLIITLGDSSVQFALLKGMGDTKGFIVGVILSSRHESGPEASKESRPKTFLSGLIGDFSIGNLGVYYASEEFEGVSFFGADEFQDATQFTPGPSRITPPQTFPKGVQFSAEVLVGGVNLLDQLALNKAETTTPKEQQPSSGKDEAGKAEETLAKGSTHWIEVKKAIGPLSIRRIGLSYEAQKLGIKLDAGLQLSVLTLSLEGLGLSYPINKFTTKPKEIWDNLEFHLDGAAVAFSGGPLTIGGGLLKLEVPDHPDWLRLDGFLLIRTEIFTITAIGSYANMNGTASLFVFAALQKELGGPAFFYVTGLAVGFGINRALKLPAIEEVYNFPLIKAATDRKYLVENLDLTTISQKLDTYIYPLPGNFWMAAGVKFSSFGFIQSFAMLTVSFGTQFEIALLGLSRISVPMQLSGEEDLTPIACAELAIKVSFSTATGLLAVEARLTDNSFLFSKDCRLMGGFAFYIWFGGEHEGDFVVTLGGYHAKFLKPPWYPVVPRLGIHWQVSTALSITGETYFALTPSCLMAGGKLAIVFQAGPIRAWFYAYADFLIAWKPFHYDIEVGIRIGVALHLVIFTLTIELAASVHLWGPPFGGIAHVSLSIISFDIPFGDQGRGEPEPLTWEQFHQSFLPRSTAKEGGDPLVTTIRITGGLISEREIGKGDEKQTLRLVNAHQFSFITESVIPSTELSLNASKANVKAAELPLGIRPMGKATLDSKHDVSLRRDGSQNGWGNEYLEFKPVLKNVPFALWSKDTSRLKVPTAETIRNVPNGLQVSLKTRAPIHSLGPIDLEKFKYEIIPKLIPWVEIQPPKGIPAPNKKTLINTIWNDPAVTQKRNAILNGLRKATDIESMELSDLAANAERIFQAMPEMAELGEPLKPPKSN